MVIYNFRAKLSKSSSKIRDKCKRYTLNFFHVTLYTAFASLTNLIVNFLWHSHTSKVLRTKSEETYFFLLPAYNTKSILPLFPSSFILLIFLAKKYFYWCISKGASTLSFFTHRSKLRDKERWGGFFFSL